jgi:hypothetical protein
MRNRKDRRQQQPSPDPGYLDNGRTTLAKERRQKRDRRKENLKLEELQLLLSEMPWYTPRNRP